MKAICRNTRIFRNVFRVLCRLAPEITLNASKHCLKVWAASSDHLILLSGKINPLFFEEYACNNQENAVICLETNIFNNVLSRIPLSDRVELDVTSKKVILKLHKPYPRTFILRGKRIWEPPIMIKDLKGHVVQSLDPYVLFQIVSDALKIADETTIKVTKKHLSFSAASSSCAFIYEQEIVNDHEIKDLSVTVLTSVLSMVNPMVRESDTIILKLAQDKPLTLNLALEGNNASFTFLISTKK